MRIGKIEIERTAALAPMAGVADSAFRQICKQFGAAYMVGEMASAKGMHYSDRKTARLLGVNDVERPVAVQLFGDEPEIVAEAAKRRSRFVRMSSTLIWAVPRLRSPVMAAARR